MQDASGIPVCTLQDGGVEDEHLANSQDWDGATIQYSGLMDLLRRTSGGMIQWTNVVSFILLRRHRTNLGLEPSRASNGLLVHHVPVQSQHRYFDTPR